MIPIYICEDNSHLLDNYKNIIENLILIDEYDMKIEAAVTRPKDLLQIAKQQQNTEAHAGFYLLDIDLRAEQNGLELAQEIRKFDPRGFIVFITTHSEMAMLTFRYQVEAMDFILKEDSQNLTARISSCLNAALERYNQFSEIKMLSFRVGSHTVHVEQNRILYIGVSQMAHKILVATTNGVKEFYGSLSDYDNILPDHFVRCHKRYIINLNHVQSVDRKSLTITFTNGQSCIASTRGIRKVVAALEQQQGQ